MHYDVVVVGGGSAGCVVAAALSADPSRQVLLLEAGPDYPGLHDLPADVADASVPTVSHDWGFASEAGGLGRSVELPRARLVGGCSATNATFLLRAAPSDYDRWAAAGNPGWSFADLLPTLRALEADTDYHDAWHGADGPIPVSRARPDELTHLQGAFLAAAAAIGHPVVEDHNRPGAEGVGPLPRNVHDGIRMSTALTHLAAARSRPNLTIRADTTVDRIEPRDGGGHGIRLAGGDVVHGAKVVLTAGAYASPAILLRSGIGPGDALRDLGIETLVDLLGVGSNLSDHPLVAVDVPTSPGFDGPRFQVLLTARSSRCPADAPPDLHFFAAGPFDDAGSPTGGVFGIVTALVSPRSRGSVRLRSRDPGDAPLIDAPLLDHPQDVELMVEATVHARRLARTRPLADLVSGPELAPGDAVSDDDLEGLADSIRARVGPYHHPVGTCGMGPHPSAGHVVDARGAVHGVDGIWVADASVIPTVPSMPTNLTAIVVATRVAEGLAAT